MISAVEWAAYVFEKEPEKILAWPGKPEFFRFFLNRLGYSFFTVVP